MLSSPHTGLKTLFGHEQLELHDKAALWDMGQKNKASLKPNSYGEDYIDYTTTYFCWNCKVFYLASTWLRRSRYRDFWHKYYIVFSLPSFSCTQDLFWSVVMVTRTMLFDLLAYFKSWMTSFKQQQPSGKSSILSSLIWFVSTSLIENKVFREYVNESLQKIFIQILTMIQ